MGYFSADGTPPAAYGLATASFLNTFQVEVANAINTPSTERASAFKIQVPPRRIASPRQITRPLLTGARYCTFSSSVAPGPVLWLIRCPIQMSKAVASTPHAPRREG